MTIFRLIDFATPVDPPLLPFQAASASSVLTLCYVGGLYLSTKTRIGRARTKEGVLLSKDDAAVVRSRMRTVTVTTAVGLAATTAFIRQKAFADQPALFGTLAALRLVGLPLPAPSFLHGNVLPLQPSITLYSLHHVLPSILLPLTVTSLLFFGPLVVEGLGGNLIGQRNQPSLRSAVRERLGNVWGLRNFVVGPVTEEVVFRGCMLSLHALAGVQRSFLLFGTPIYFGFAHLHHAYEGYVKGGRTRQALVRSSLVSLFQFTYTTLFGWYANFLFMRTNSLLAPIAAHVFCNLMGFPNPVQAVEEHPRRKWLIYASHLAGIAAFAFSVMPLTKPGLFGGSWYW